MESLKISNTPPVIEFSMEKLLKPEGRSLWLSTSRKVTEALEEYGCFVAVYDGVTMQLHNAVFSAVEELYDLPLETKIKNIYEKPFIGYNWPRDPRISPLFEAMGIEHGNSLEAVQSFANILWPHGNDSFCETVASYAKQVSELELMVKKMVCESYGVEKYYESLKEASSYILRMMKYRAPEKNETNEGAMPHTDKNLISILHQNEVNGLEIQRKDGSWIGFDVSSPSSFVVMAGDAFMAWSNGRIHSALHRVVMNGSNARYSVTLFVYEGMIQAPEELVDDEHPLLFKPFDNFGLFRYLSFEEGYPLDSSIVKAYCAAGSNAIQSVN